MKRLIHIGVIAAVVAVAGIVYFATHYFSNQYLARAYSSTEPSTAKCEGSRETHVVTIQNDTITPVHTEALLCDTLTITNKDEKIRLIAFGEHDHHLFYDGVTEKVLEKSQSLTVVLDQTGTYKFHDHLQNGAQGDFTVGD